MVGGQTNASGRRRLAELLLAVALGACAGDRPLPLLESDLRMISSPDLGPKCRSDVDCTGPDLPRCDGQRGECVACLPSNDNCPAGQVCQHVNGVWFCFCGCINNSDCSKLGGGSLCCDCACANPSSDLNHCGACGARCPPVNHGLPACLQGRCVVAACDPGFDDCDHNGANGCELQVTDDPVHCGGCDIACATFPNATPACDSGRCTLVCAPGWADCDRGMNNGCEVDLASESGHCGGCGRQCAPFPNGAVGCVAGKCVPACKQGYADCDNTSMNGCEVSLLLDAMNCGACAKVCPQNTKCVSGTCQ